MVKEIQEKNFANSTAEGVTLVDFWAPWCGPCRMQGPIVDKLAEDLAGKACVGKVNVDEEPNLASQFGVMSIPTLILFKDGKAVDKMVGLQSQDRLKAKIEKYL